MIGIQYINVEEKKLEEIRNHLGLYLKDVPIHLVENLRNSGFKSRLDMSILVGLNKDDVVDVEFHDIFRDSLMSDLYMVLEYDPAPSKRYNEVSIYIDTMIFRCFESGEISKRINAMDKLINQFVARMNSIAEEYSNSKLDF